MTEVHQMLANLWYAVITLIVLNYIIFDGFGLGIGLLAATTKDTNERNAMIDSVAVGWHTSELWLLVLGTALFGAFPPAFNLAMRALLVPAALLIAGLAVRGVALWNRRHRHRADSGIGVVLGTALTVLAQGLMLGAYINGLPSAGHPLAASLTDGWMSSTSALTTLVVTCAYMLMGATFLIRIVRSHQSRRRYRIYACALGILLAASAIALGLLEINLRAGLVAKWNTKSGLAILIVLLAVATGALIVTFATSIRRRRTPFGWSITAVAALFVTFAYALFPYLVPDSLTATAAASADYILVYLLTAAGIVIPVLLFFNGYQRLLPYDGFRLSDGGHGMQAKTPHKSID